MPLCIHLDISNTVPQSFKLTTPVNVFVVHQLFKLTARVENVFVFHYWCYVRSNIALQADHIHNLSEQAFNSVMSCYVQNICKQPGGSEEEKCLKTLELGSSFLDFSLVCTQLYEA